MSTPSDHPPRASAPEKLTTTKPWGGFHQLAHNEHSTVKILWVEPGHQLSLQTHKLRSEFWYVLEGEMEVHLDGATITVTKDEHIFIPCGAKHRACGLTTTCRWLEIAFGHFDEDDIVRHEDVYGRA